MGVTDIKYGKDRIRIEYHLQKPYGMKDVTGRDTILHENIGQLEPLPEEFPETGIPVNRDIFKAPVVGVEPSKVVAFVFEKYSETSTGPAEEEYRGVFRVERKKK